MSTKLTVTSPTLMFVWGCCRGAHAGVPLVTAVSKSSPKRQCPGCQAVQHCNATSASCTSTCTPPRRTDDRGGPQHAWVPQAETDALPSCGLWDWGLGCPWPSTSGSSTRIQGLGALARDRALFGTCNIPLQALQEARLKGS